MFYPGKRWLQFILLFVVIFLALDLGYRYAIGTWIQGLLIGTLTTPAAAWLIRSLFHGAVVWAAGNNLIMPFGQITIGVGCEGTEAMFLVVAAVAAVRASWRWTTVGLVCGVLLVYALNLFRLLGFYVVLKAAPSWFTALHDLIGPTIIMVICFSFFVVWLNAAVRPTNVPA